MASGDWANLPSVVLYDLYRVLPLEERLASSSTCKKWRDAFFMFPNWRHLHLITTKSNQEKNEFLARMGSKFCKTLHITFMHNTFNNVVNIVKQLSPILRINEFQLVGSFHPNTNKIMWLCFDSHIYPMLENCAQLSTLFLNHIGNVNRLAKLVSKHSLSLNSLGLGIILPKPMKFTNLELFSVANLKVLYLDSSWLNDDLILWISTNLPKLRVLSLTVNGYASLNTLCLDGWKTFNQSLPNCEVRLTYLKVIVRGIAENQQHLFRSLHIRNLTHVRMILCSWAFCELFLTLLVGSNARTFVRSIWSIYDESEVHLLSPHVYLICAWRMDRLRELYVCGCVFDDYDLIGLTRLRSSLHIYIPNENIRVTSTREKLDDKKISPTDPKFTDKRLPIDQREAFILSTIASYDSKVKEKWK